MKKSDEDEAIEAVEVQKHPGPLGPWKLSISVAVSAAFTGLPLYDAVVTGVGTDMALLRSFGVGFLTWIAASSVNRVVATAQQSVEADSVVRGAPATAWIDRDHHIGSSNG